MLGPNVKIFISLGKISITLHFSQNDIHQQILFIFLHDKWNEFSDE